jgi:hypothetical protein
MVALALVDMERACTVATCSIEALWVRLQHHKRLGTQKWDDGELNNA